MKKIVAFLMLTTQFVSSAKAQFSYYALLAHNMQEGRSLLLKQPNEMLLFTVSSVGKFNTSRLYPNGNTDDAYRGNYTANNLFRNKYNCTTYTTALDKWGRIIVAGASATDSHSAQMATMVRFASNGAVDEYFEPVVAQVAIGDSSQYNGVWMQPDEKMLIAGSVYLSGAWHIFWSRHMYNGVQDTTFGHSGFVVDDYLPVNSKVLAGIAQPDNKYIVAGCNYNNESCNLLLVRYKPDGSRDVSFGEEGVAMLQAEKSNFFLVRKVLLQPDNKILVAGICSGDNGGQDFFVARFDTSGKPDHTFGKAGIVITNVTDNDRADEMVLMANGNIVVSGAGNNRNEVKYSRYVLYRLLPDGNQDPNYGYFGVSGNKSLDAYVIRKGYSSLSNNISLTSHDGRIIGFNELVAPNGTEIVLVFTEFMPEKEIGIVDLPTKKTQYNVYPNPLSSSATFLFELIENQKVTISLMDMTGKEVKRITDNELMEEGAHIIQLDFPSFTQPGNYLLRLITEEGYKVTVVITKI
jgi:uncharacterized delta-60 repeat protein